MLAVRQLQQLDSFYILSCVVLSIWLTVFDRPLGPALTVLLRELRFQVTTPNEKLNHTDVLNQ